MKKIKELLKEIIELLKEIVGKEKNESQPGGPGNPPPGGG